MILWSPTGYFETYITKNRNVTSEQFSRTTCSGIILFAGLDVGVHSTGIRPHLSCLSTTIDSILPGTSISFAFLFVFCSQSSSLYDPWTNLLQFCPLHQFSMSPVGPYAWVLSYVLGNIRQTHLYMYVVREKIIMATFWTALNQNRPLRAWHL